MGSSTVSHQVALLDESLTVCYLYLTSMASYLKHRINWLTLICKHLAAKAFQHDVKTMRGLILRVLLKANWHLAQWKQITVILFLN